MAVYKIEQLGALLESKVRLAYAKKVENILDQIQKDVEAIHKQFFVILGQQIVGQTNSSGFSALKEYKTNWRDLTEPYTDKRVKKGIEPNQFFQYSGELSTALNELKPERVFGHPVITYKRGSLAAGDSEEVIYNRNKKGTIFRKGLNARGERTALANLSQNLAIRISINPFSKIKSGSGKGSFSTNISLKDYFTGGNKDIGMKLGNSRTHPNSRSVVNPYLNWWVNVKVRAIVTRRLK